MKSFIVCLAFLACGIMAPSIMASSSYSTDGPVCPADAPCLYRGKARPDDGGTYINITVHRLNDGTTDLVAKFKADKEIQTAYVFPSGNGDGKWYFNWDSKKYWFEM